MKQHIYNQLRTAKGVLQRKHVSSKYSYNDPSPERFCDHQPCQHRVETIADKTVPVPHCFNNHFKNLRRILSEYWLQTA